MRSIISDRVLISSILIFGLSFFLGSCGSKVDENAPLVLSSYRVKATDAQMKLIAANFEVVRRFENSWFEVIVPKNRTSELTDITNDAVLIDDDISDVFKKLEEADPDYFSGYHTYKDLEELLKKWKADYPTLAKVYIYGKSRQGRNLYAIKISDHVGDDENEPELMITGATHGNEIAGTEVVINLVDSLLQNYGKDARLTKMVDNHEIYFIPAVNVDGFVQRSRYDDDNDPNRVYPYPDEPDVKPVGCIEPLVEFFHAHNIVGSLDLHTYGQLLMYPWAYTGEHVDAADDEKFNVLGKQMAEKNAYTVGPVATTIYRAPGSSTDYYYWKNHTMAFAAELTNTHTPSASRLPEIIQEAKEMTWRLIEYF